MGTYQEPGRGVGTYLGHYGTVRNILHIVHVQSVYTYLVQLVVNFVEDECFVIVSSVTLHNLVNYGKETTARIIIMSSNKIRTGSVFRAKSFTCV